MYVKTRFISPGKINGFMVHVMTPFSLPPEGLPFLCTVMTTFLHALSLPTRRLKKASCYRARISSEVFSTILPLHWTQVEYCFIFCAVGVPSQYYFLFHARISRGSRMSYLEEVKPCALVLGHSFVRRLKPFAKQE